MLAVGVTLLSASAARAAPDPPVVPQAMLPESWHHFVVGISAERGDDNLVGHRALDDQLLGLSVEWRTRYAGANVRLMLSPNLDRFENVRGLASAGVRGYVELFGLEWSYGLAGHVEARLRDHFWLAYLTPLELGAPLYSKGSWRIRLYTGARLAMAGALINSFLVDPNGFNNENALDALHAEKHQAWEAFVNVVFARRIH